MFFFLLIIFSYRTYEMNVCCVHPRNQIVQKRKKTNLTDAYDGKFTTYDTKHEKYQTNYCQNEKTIKKERRKEHVRIPFVFIFIDVDPKHQTSNNNGSSQKCQRKIEKGTQKKYERQNSE